MNTQNKPGVREGLNPQLCLDEGMLCDEGPRGQGWNNVSNKIECWVIIVTRK